VHWGEAGVADGSGATGEAQPTGSNIQEPAEVAPEAADGMMLVK